MSAREGNSEERRSTYRLDPKPIGRGGFCDVFVATVRASGARVAFKRLRERTEEGRRRFRREIDVQSRLRHPHVMPIIDSDPSLHWYVMPLAQGDLQFFLPTLTVDDLFTVLRQVGSGLAAAHARGFVHRDVTLHNILALADTDGSTRWVIADWGLVRLPAGESGTAKTTGTIGTVRFIAPEVLREPRAATPRSDVYSLGIVAQSVLEQRQWTDVSAVSTFIAHTTYIDPRQRPQDAIDAIALLASSNEPRRESYLVWARPTDGALTTTYAIEDDLSGAAHVIGTAIGLMISDGRRLLTWHTSPRRITLIPVNQWGDNLPAPPSREVDIQEVRLVDFDEGHTLLVSPVEPRTTDENFDFSRATVPVWSAGPFVALHRHEYIDGGGAHGFTNSNFDVLDVRSMSPVEQLFPADFEGVLASARDLAIAKRRAADPDWDYGVPQLVSYQPQIADSPARELLLQFSFDCPYGSSDGHWSSYTISEHIATECPNHLRDLLAPPPAVKAFLRSIGPTKAFGWSAVPTSLLRDKWMSLF